MKGRGQHLDSFRWTPEPACRSLTNSTRRPVSDYLVEIKTFGRVVKTSSLGPTHLKWSSTLGQLFPVQGVKTRQKQSHFMIYSRGLQLGVSSCCDWRPLITQYQNCFCFVAFSPILSHGLFGWNPKTFGFYVEKWQLFDQGFKTFKHHFKYVFCHCNRCFQ